MGPHEVRAGILLATAFISPQAFAGLGVQVVEGARAAKQLQAASAGAPAPSGLTLAFYQISHRSVLFFPRYRARELPCGRPHAPRSGGHAACQVFLWLN